MAKIITCDETGLKCASDLIKSGEVVAFPTETVYGLGANACNGMAVAKIFAAKKRPQFNPLIIHGDDLSMLENYAVFDERAHMVAAYFWPGPLSMILPLKINCGISDLVTAGLKTIAVRVPAHPVARDFIKLCGVPIAAPSANLSGTLSPTAPHHVQDSLGDYIAGILAGGTSHVGLESTVLDLTDDYPVVLRPGAITAQDISDVLGCEVICDFESKDKPKSPGQLLRHYAPQKILRLNAVDIDENESLLAFGSTRFMAQKSGGSVKDFEFGRVKNLSEAGDLFEAASHLFGYLRELDNAPFEKIAVMNIPNTGIGLAINDRLKRAVQSQ